MLVLKLVGLLPKFQIILIWLPPKTSAIPFITVLKEFNILRNREVNSSRMFSEEYNYV